MRKSILSSLLLFLLLITTGCKKDEYDPSKIVYPIQLENGLEEILEDTENWDCTEDCYLNYKNKVHITAKIDEQNSETFEYFVLVSDEFDGGIVRITYDFKNSKIKATSITGVINPWCDLESENFECEIHLADISDDTFELLSEIKEYILEILYSYISK